MSRHLPGSFCAAAQGGSSPMRSGAPAQASSLGARSSGSPQRVTAAHGRCGAATSLLSKGSSSSPDADSLGQTKRKTEPDCLKPGSFPKCSKLPGASRCFLEPADRRTPHCFQALDHGQSFALNPEAWWGTTCLGHIPEF